MLMTQTIKRRLLIFLSIPVLLLIPLLAMQWSADVVWTGLDFLVMGVILTGLAMGIELLFILVPAPRKRLRLLAVLLFFFFLLWAELAVGVFGTILVGS